MAGAYPFVPVILALVTSVNSLWNHFASDDLEQVLGNPFIKHLGNLPAAFTTSVWSFTAANIVFTVDPYFRPIFSSLFTLNNALFGTAPWGWHLVNILIHAAVTLMVFVVSREVTERNWVAMLTAALFAASSRHAESVAWVSGVTDPLMALLLLPAFYFYLRFRKQGTTYLLVCSLGFFFLALLSKETALCAAPGGFVLRTFPLQTRSVIHATAGSRFRTIGSVRSADSDLFPDAISRARHACI